MPVSESRRGFYEFSFHLFRSKVEWTVVISRTFSNFLKMFKKKGGNGQQGWMVAAGRTQLSVLADTWEALCTCREPGEAGLSSMR